MSASINTTSLYWTEWFEAIGMAVAAYAVGRAVFYAWEKIDRIEFQLRRIADNTAKTAKHTADSEPEAAVTDGGTDD